MSRTWMTAALVAALAACGGEEGERVELGEQQQATRENARSTWSPELTAQVDSANAAYAAGDFDTAAEVFTAVTEEHPDMGVAWFGLYMAEKARGNTEAADAALAKVNELSPELAPAHDSGGMTMPPGHPSPEEAESMEAPPLGG